jgi:hypothetical protein
MSILQFKNNLINGGVRANQFRVELSFPSGVGNGASAALKASFLCEAAQLPASNMGVADVFYRGRRIPVAGEREFQPWTITVVNETDFEVYTALQDWMEMMNQVDTNMGQTTVSTYVADLNVIQLDRNDSPLKQFKFKDAFPTSISQIDLAFGTNNQIERFQVTFDYTNWVIV